MSLDSTKESPYARADSDRSTALIGALTLSAMCAVYAALIWIGFFEHGVLPEIPQNILTAIVAVALPPIVLFDMIRRGFSSKATDMGPEGHKSGPCENRERGPTSTQPLEGDGYDGGDHHGEPENDKERPGSIVTSPHRCPPTALRFDESSGIKATLSAEAGR